ncbi:hypothetical protein ABZ694_31930 [Streptomyces albidoflavus]|uniref:hypothetical protein n=1 Tax=Streptomyces albidoflavus TaxID=1886 RepID=UPI0033CE2DBD
MNEQDRPERELSSVARRIVQAVRNPGSTATPSSPADSAGSADEAPVEDFTEADEQELAEGLNEEASLRWLKEEATARYNKRRAQNALLVARAKKARRTIPEEAAGPDGRSVAMVTSPRSTLAVRVTNRAAFAEFIAGIAPGEVEPVVREAYFKKLARQWVKRGACLVEVTNENTGEVRALPAPGVEVYRKASSHAVRLIAADPESGVEGGAELMVAQLSREWLQRLLGRGTADR